MGKVIKLTEKDIKNIVSNIIKEQTDMSLGDKNTNMSLPPYPEPQRDEINQVREKMSQEMKTPLVTKETEAGRAKKSVKFHLAKLIDSMEDLLYYSGVNRQENDFTSDIKKIVAKFDKLYGDGKPNPEKPKNNKPIN